MDLGISRFVEMFEERFGRRPTTLLLAVIGVAVVVWGLRTIIEGIIYVYKLARSADFIGALAAEHAATHLIIFSAQIVVTFLVLIFVWQWFYRRRIRALEKWAEEQRAEIAGYMERGQEFKAEWAGYEKKYEGYMAKNELVKELVAKSNDLFQKTHAAMVVIKEAVDKKVAENPELFKRPPAEPPPTPESPAKPILK